ncbi:MAG: branched-chain amino acid ABC transporter permease [Planctomycetia bacterium]|nr:branched-chain amino acid ABC transporter permease [Planctomycetia bacterium]
MNRKVGPRWALVVFLVLAIYPLFPAFDGWFFAATARSLGAQMPTLFIFAILAMGLNLVVGNVGLLHLGIAAFFGIGAYTMGILTVPAYPFEIGFWLALPCGIAAAAAVGLFIGVPTLRLRGDYLALVTLGFGEVVRFTLKNLDAITAGTRSLVPVPPPATPVLSVDWLQDFRPFYYLTLGFLVIVYWILGSLERSKLGRAWVAVREDELAASCMGLNVSRLKLSAFICSAGIAGLAGGLYASTITSTAQPDAYDFNRSIFLLCCLILGGLGSRNGVLLGVFLLYGFDQILSPIVDEKLQLAYGAPIRREFLGIPISAQMQTFAGWRLFLFGVVLIVMMRYRPSGLIPNDRIKEELPPDPDARPATK